MQVRQCVLSGFFMVLMCIFLVSGGPNNQFCYLAMWIILLLQCLFNTSDLFITHYCVHVGIESGHYQLGSKQKFLFSIIRDWFFPLSQGVLCVHLNINPSICFKFVDYLFILLRVALGNMRSQF